MVDKPDGCAATEEQASEQEEEMSQQECNRVQQREIRSSVPREGVLMVQKMCCGSKIGHESVMHPCHKEGKQHLGLNFQKKVVSVWGEEILSSALVRLHL